MPDPINTIQRRDAPPIIEAQVIKVYRIEREYRQGWPRWLYVAAGVYVLCACILVIAAWLVLA